MMRRLRRFPLANLARLCGLLSLFSVCFVFVGARWVEAQMGELLQGLGAELMAFPGGSAERPRTIHVNGARFFLSTATVGVSTEAALDHYEALCRGRDAGLSRGLSELSDGFVTNGSATTRRTGGPAGGHVSCLDLGRELDVADALLSRLSAFAETGDLAELGAFRYAYAQPLDEDPSQTFVLTLWTEGPVSLFELLPASGKDVPGQDPPAVPRPHGLQRILSAWQSEAPYGLTLYRTRSRPEKDLEAFYRRELSSLRWKLLEPATDKPIVINGTRVLGFERDGRMLTVLLEGSEDGPQNVMILTTDFP